MRVLVISRNAWDDTNSIGNTMSNFFKGIGGVELANIYFRSAKPNNNVCEKYYCVTETEILKKWFSPSKIGKTFLWKEPQKAFSDSKRKNEKAIIRFIHKYNLKSVYKISDLVWYSKKWINKNLEKFIREFSPDVMITFVKSAPQYYLTVKYLREKFNIPLLSFIADDEYTSFAKKRLTKDIENIRYILNESEVVKGCSQEICDYYNSVFNCNATPFYKGCDLSNQPKSHINLPIKLVYAGNLLYGRAEVIKKIAYALEEYDKNGNKVLFEIYSNTLLSADEKEYFSQSKCTRYMGRQNYETIVRQLEHADIVLHAESFDEEQILKTKYSFSTKIIDCLQSGSILLAVGPSEIASINYIKKIPGAFVIDSLSCLDKGLRDLLDDAHSFKDRAQEIRKFAKFHHDSKENSKELKKILETIGKGK